MLKTESDQTLWIRSQNPLQAAEWQAHWRKILNSSSVGSTFVCVIDALKSSEKEVQSFLKLLVLLGPSYVEEIACSEDDCKIDDGLPVGTRVLVDWPAYKCAFGGES